MAGIKDYRIVIELCEEEFKRSMGRKPRDQDEFDEWAHLAEKGLLNGQIDWDIIYECAHDAMHGGWEGDSQLSCSYSYSNMCKEVDENMAFRPTRHLMEGELDNTRLGRVTGWIQFAGMKGTVVLNLRGNFHRDIQGAKIRITGNAKWESSEAIARMRGCSRFQNGKVGNITAGLPPADFGAYPFIEWYSEENGRVVIEPDRDHIQVIGQPVPLEQAIPVSAREQAENMAEFLETIARSIERHG